MIAAARPRTSSLFLLSLFIIVSGGCSASTPQVDPSAHLDALVDEYLEIRGRRSSDWSTEALSENGAPDFSPERFAARIQPQRDLLVRLQAIEPEGLTLPEQTDRRVMIALLEWRGRLSHCCTFPCARSRGCSRPA